MILLKKFTLNFSYHLLLFFLLFFTIQGALALKQPSPSVGIQRRKHQQSLFQRYAIEPTSLNKNTKDETWQEVLDEESYNVLRQKGTEPPFSSPLNEIIDKDNGLFTCKGCGAPLFSPTSKFDSGTGWPSFYSPITSTAVSYETDYDLILPRNEVTCANCGGHLGHVFEDGPQPTGLRYCMNGVAMEYQTMSNEDDRIAIKEESPVEASKMPMASILPGILVNLGVAVLFLSSWVAAHFRNLPPAEDIGTIVLQNYPLPIAVYYIYLAGNMLKKVK